MDRNPPLLNKSYTEQDDSCARLFLNGLEISCPGKFCWCELLQDKQDDELLEFLGRTLIDSLHGNSFIGTEGNRIIILELRI